MYDDLEFDAEEELKRADHMLYVTLKYTRTADVIHNILKRLINAYEYSILRSLTTIKKDQSNIITQEKLDSVKEKIPEFKKYTKEYLKIKQIAKSKYRGECEFRKGVVLITDTDRVDMEKVKIYFDNTKECVLLLKNYFK